MNKYLSQPLHLMRQNPFYCLISVAGTAITIAFVMVVVMIYRFRSADMAPETDRSQVLYTGTVNTHRTDGTDVSNSNGMGRAAYEALLTDLPGVEDITYHSTFGQAVCSLPASYERFRFRVKNVAANWFDFFRYEFIAGRPFTQAEYDLARSAYAPSESQYWTTQAVDNPAYRSVVLTEHAALQLFGSVEEALGKVFWMNFSSSTVVGVVKDVSSIFQTAYADVFQPYPLANEEEFYRSKVTDGMAGYRYSVLKFASDADVSAIRSEIERRENLLNSRGGEYVMHLNNLYTHTDYTFFRDSSIDARLVYVLLILVLIGVPAISISGLMNAQMQGRLSEVAIRKAYGASNFSILRRFFMESLLNTLIGGVLGFGLSCLLLWLGRVWLFGSGGTVLRGISLDGSMLFSPQVFGIVLLVCLVFNLLAVLLPVGLAVRRNIVVTLKGE